MPNVMTNPTNFQRRINTYVPAMMYSSDVNYNNPTRVNFGAPAAAVANSIVNAQSIAAAITVDLTGVAQIPETYGRTLTYVASGASGATITLNGWDYLGQPLREDITMNGATPVVGKKAFKTFLNLVINTTTAATTINIGTGTGLGLPYKALRVAWEVANGVAAAAGTLTAGVLTDPQTAVTGDPRGTYVTTTTMNGSNIISAVFDFANDVNTANNGGLHGIRHFAG
jgi:hypothetical protein